MVRATTTEMFDSTEVGVLVASSFVVGQLGVSP